VAAAQAVVFSPVYVFATTKALGISATGAIVQVGPALPVR
jgi:hypothetical protein